MSPCRSLFVASQNVATSQPGHRVFECLRMAPEDPRNQTLWKWWARGSGFFCENFSPFHPLLPPQKAIFQSCLACPSSPFEDCSTKMGILDIEPVYSTLCPSITSTRSTSKFHFNTFRTAYEVTSCSKNLLTARTVHRLVDRMRMCIQCECQPMPAWSGWSGRLAIQLSCPPRSPL